MTALVHTYIGSQWASIMYLLGMCSCLSDAAIFKSLSSYKLPFSVRCLFHHKNCAVFPFQFSFRPKGLRFKIGRFWPLSLAHCGFPYGIALPPPVIHTASCGKTFSGERSIVKELRLPRNADLYIY